MFLHVHLLKPLAQIISLSDLTGQKIIFLKLWPFRKLRHVQRLSASRARWPALTIWSVPTGSQLPSGSGPLSIRQTDAPLIHRVGYCWDKWNTRSLCMCAGRHRCRKLCVKVQLIFQAVELIYWWGRWVPSRTCISLLNSQLITCRFMSVTSGNQFGAKFNLFLNTNTFSAYIQYN